MDISIIVILLLSGINGLYIGFIRSSFNLLVYILSGYITKIYYPFLAAFIKNNPDILSKMKDIVNSGISKIIKNSEGSTREKALEYFKVPDAFKSSIEGSVEFQKGVEDLSKTASGVISEAFIDIFINIISVIVVFLVAKTLLTVIMGMIDNFFKLPLLKDFNRILGLILGIAKGLLIIYIIFTILTPLIMMSPEGYISEVTYNSNIGLYFYNNNIILNFIKDNEIFKNL